MKNIASTAPGSEVPSGKPEDELGGLSDVDLDNIFNSLGKKTKTAKERTPKGTCDPKTLKGRRAKAKTKTKTKTGIPKELEGLGLGSLLDELDAPLNEKAPVFKPVIVANKSWWVPENHGQLLAVQIDQPQQYQQAIIDKMANLAEEWGGLERALASANNYLRQEGSTYLPMPEDVEQLVEFVIQNNSRIAEMINEGDPEVANPAPPQEAVYCVKNQEMNWEDFLT
jgi:hypothetical protein